jgi:hypothetical protein
MVIGIPFPGVAPGSLRRSLLWRTRCEDWAFGAKDVSENDGKSARWVRTRLYRSTPAPVAICLESSRRGEADPTVHLVERGARWSKRGRDVCRPQPGVSSPLL